ncbi:MAG: helix-turn-helix transcriptional regulator [Clostridia bacterium]|nr:helix-turn-helix transcriptional regulator [Clostridia bacterium]
MSDNERFCQNIKKLRERHHLTKTDMVKKLKISIPTLKKIESGELPKRLTVKVIYAIVDEFNISADDLFK